MSFNRYDYCKYCKAELPKIKSKRYRYFMCNDCHLDKVDGNYELKKIFDELREKKTDADKDDWSADNLEVADEPPLKNKRGATYVYTRNIIDDI